MKILAFETAVDPGSVALWLDGEVVERFCPEGMPNSATLLPLAEQALAGCGLTFAGLDGLAFGMGPGSFTGLRVSCGVAQGLAIGRDLPLLGIGTLEAMAMSAGGSRVMATLDARMGEVYFASFENGLRRGAESLCAPETVTLPDTPDWLACGNALMAYPQLRERLAGCVSAWKPEIMPGAGAVARLAAPRLARGERIDPADAAPLYVRDKVAKTIAERLAEGGRA